MILITDSTKEFSVLSDTYGVDKRYIFRVHAYKGRWAHTFPFDPSVGYNVVMDSDTYFQGIVAGKKVIFDLNFLASFENNRFISSIVFSTSTNFSCVALYVSFLQDGHL